MIEYFFSEAAEHLGFGDDHAVFLVAENQQRVAGVDAVKLSCILGNDNLPAIADLCRSEDMAGFFHPEHMFAGWQMNPSNPIHTFHTFHTV